MRLAQIKLAGFKSFVEPTQLLLPSRLVGIVGPNGCGKSNVIDAVRWVLGESKAAELRGETMQDVIFNGSSERRPASRASVELIFDNDRGRVKGPWGQFTEISVKRVITRETGSTYYINGQVVRRRDVQDLFMGTGLGPNAYAIIGQGMVSKMVESKPEDLRVYLEEAAGTSRYRERRRETENRLFEARENLNRVSDLQTELVDRLVQLDEQAKVALQYREWETSLLEAKRFLAVVKRNEAAQARQIHLVACEKVEGDILASQAQLNSLLTQLEQVKQSYEQAGLKLQEEQALFYEISAKVGQIETEARMQQTSKQNVQELLAKLEQQIVKLVAELSSLEQEKVELETGLPEQTQKAQALEMRLKESNVLLPTVEQAYKEARGVMDTAREETARVRQQLEVMATESRQMERELGQWQERKNRLVGEQQGLQVPSIEVLAQTQQQLVDLELAEKNLAQALQEGQQEESSLEHKRKIGQDEQGQLQVRLSQTQSRLSVLKQLQSEYEAPKTMVQWLTQQGFDGIAPLWQSIKVDSGWGMCVEALLRERLNAIKINDLSRLAGFESMPPPLRFSFFSEGEPGVEKRAHLQNKPEGAIALSDLVKVNGGKASVMEEWLAGVWCADHLKMALERRNELGETGVWVTPKGHIVSKHSLNLLPLQKTETSLLSRQDEIESLQATETEQTSQLSELRSTVFQVQEQLAAIKERLRQEREIYQKSLKQIQDLQIKKVRLEEEAQRYQLRQGQIKVDLEQMDQHITELTQKIQLSQQQFETLDAQLAQAQQHQETQKQKEEEALKQVSFQRSVIQQLEHQYKDTAFALERIHNKHKELERVVLLKKQQLEDCQKDQTAHKTTLMSLMDEKTQQALQEALGIKQGRETSLQQSRSLLESATQALKQQEQILVKAQQEQEPLRRALSEVQLKEQAARLAVEQFTQEVADLGGVEPDSQDLENLKVSSLQQKISRLKGQVEALGPVNLMALEELKSAQERQKFLEDQVKDLTEAANTLEEAIRKIDRETRERLMETFNMVNQYFSEMFPRLFGGGQARLSLSEDDILSAGVQVMAQPPGKRNSSIVLLSGGEKALTATALVFAFFRLNPAPFCLLDEVDAPLDDVNTGRYCELVKSMVQETQFIFISHNKIAMEMAQHLIGVTMHEQGVSRVVSVDLESAVQMTH